MTLAAGAAACPRSAGLRGRGRVPPRLALLLVLLLVLLSALDAVSPGRASAISADTLDPELDAPPAERTAEEILTQLTEQVAGIDGRLATLEEAVAGNRAAIAQQTDRLKLELDDLAQRLATLGEAVTGNREAIAQQADRLDAEGKRVDTLALGLDSLERQLEQAQALLETHETRIEENAVRLFETLMTIGEIRQAVSALQSPRQRGTRAPVSPPPATERDASDGAEESNRVIASSGLPSPLPLGLLLSVGVLLYPAARRAPAGPTAEPTAAGTTAPVLLLALTGAVLGFMLLGFGIRAGSGLAGVFGMSVEVLSALLQAAPDAGVPEFAAPLLAQLPSVVAVALLAAVTAGSRLSAVGGLLVGLLLGALLLPLFGHWSGTPGLGEAQGTGWLLGLGFDDRGEVVASALVGGGAALGLALGLGAPPRATMAPPKSTLCTIAVLLLWVGWLAPRVAGAQGPPAAAVLLLSCTAALGALLISALYGALFRGGPRRLQGLPAALVAAVIAAPAVDAEAGLLAALLLGALVGLLHAVLAPPLERLDTALELPVAFCIGGIAAALAPALVGPEGFLFMPVVTALPAQLIGAGVALALGLTGGWLLGRLLRPGSAPELAAAPADPTT